MDLGAVGLDGLVGSDTGFVPLASTDPETKHSKWYGSGFLKQQRSAITEDEWRSSKLAKTDDISASKAMLFQHKNSLLRSNATLFSDGYNSGSMHGMVTGARGPFTPSQWMELEHQALIYKYITSNVPVPSHLLIPIKKALESAGFYNLSTGLLRPNASNGGWGGFHLGFSNNTDPEPGRCRRTDGKKWRCSRDAVVDQKYCERHMNRGRHRSRKPVEGQSGHAVTVGTTNTTNSNTVPSTTVSTFAQHHQQPPKNMTLLHLALYLFA
ncbi:WRC domain [Sesbania bispinosa]|nr:WRC domain [Sesbania bispinosa]